MTALFEWLLSLLKQFRIFVVVLPWETVIRCRLGSRVAVWGPGWHFRIPFIDSLNCINTRTRIAAVPMQTLTTSDGQSLSVSFSIGFKITDPRAALMRFAEPETSISAAAQSMTAGYVSGRALAGIAVSEMEAAVRVRLLAECDTAFQIEFVRLVDFVAAPTMRLLQEQWRHQTSTSERQI